MAHHVTTRLAPDKARQERAATGTNGPHAMKLLDGEKGFQINNRRVACRVHKLAQIDTSGVRRVPQHPTNEACRPTELLLNEHIGFARRFELERLTNLRRILVWNQPHVVAARVATGRDAAPLTCLHKRLLKGAKLIRLLISEVLMPGRQDGVEVHAERPRRKLLHSGHNTPARPLDPVRVLNRQTGVTEEPRQVIDDDPFPSTGLDSFYRDLKLWTVIGPARFVKVRRQNFHTPLARLRESFDRCALIVGASKALAAPSTDTRNSAIADVHRRYNTAVRAFRTARTSQDFGPHGKASGLCGSGAFLLCGGGA